MFHKPMSRKRYLAVANFDKTQMYKDRNPIWIKLHCAILDDYEFCEIADETKFHAVALMLLASRLNNKFPDDEAWLRRKINANSEINLKLLLEIGFLEVVKCAVIACNPKQTKDKSVKQPKKLRNAEQNRTEENRKEHNTTQQTEDENVVVVCDFENSSEDKAENQSSLLKNDFTGNGHLSEFGLNDCLRYVERCQLEGQSITNPKGLATTLYQTGKADAFIRATLYPEQQAEVDKRIFGEPIQFSDEPCRVCFGAKMADADGRGFRACEHCRNERGKSTGFEPKGEMDDETAR